MFATDCATHIHTSGITSRDEDGNVIGEGDIRAQTRQALEKLSEVLAAGGCALSDVIKLTVFVTDISLFDDIHAVRSEYFSEPYPASTMVQITRLVDERSMIEIEAIAHRIDKQPTR